MNTDSEQERTKETEIETAKYAKYAEKPQKKLKMQGVRIGQASGRRGIIRFKRLVPFRSFDNRCVYGVAGNVAARVGVAAQARVIAPSMSATNTFLSVRNR